jgi:cytochrome c oxidase subunit 2
MHKTWWPEAQHIMEPAGIGSEIPSLVAQTGGVSRTPLDVFNQVFLVFVVLGTIVGVVVIAYTLSKAYRYRDDGERDDEADSGSKKIVRPTLGEIPTGSGGGGKLFLSFGISAVIVLSLIVWTYSALLFVEDTPTEVEEESMEVDVVGKQFNWEYTYPNGHSEPGTLRVPKGQPIELNVTSADVWHAFGIKEFKVKADAIPGQTTSAWFVAEETGTYEAVCYELCGAGHSGMRGDVIVMEPEAYEEWYANTTGESAASIEATGGDR